MVETDIKIRRACLEDLPEIIRLIADDFLGRQRESFELPLRENYVKAFTRLTRTPATS